jgi:hypothetical protein
MSERKRILQSSTEVGTRRALKGFFHVGTLCNKWRRLCTNSFNRPGDLDNVVLHKEPSPRMVFPIPAVTLTDRPRPSPLIFVITGCV